MLTSPDIACFVLKKLGIVVSPVLVLLLMIGSVPTVFATACAPSESSTATSTFNGTSISSGDYVWFNAVLKLTGLTVPNTATLTISFTSQQITITPTSGSPVILSPPNAEVIYQPGASGSGSTAFTSGEWVTTIPWADQGTGNQFLSGLSYLVPGTPQPIWRQCLMDWNFQRYCFVWHIFGHSELAIWCCSIHNIQYHLQFLGS